MTISDGKHIFEVVELIPASPQYEIWNIPDITGNEEFIPLCTRADPDDPDNYSVNTTNLLAIRVDPKEYAILTKAAHRGITNVDKALEIKNDHRRNEQIRLLASQAFNILDQISL